MRVEFRFNGDTNLILTPENDKDWKLLDLGFSGMVVKEIRKPVRDSEAKESLTIVLISESENKQQQHTPAPAAGTTSKEGKQS